jgi:hypothetical protein
MTIWVSVIKRCQKLHPLIGLSPQNQTDFFLPAGVSILASQYLFPFWELVNLKYR